MKPTKHYICKKTAYMSGRKIFEARQKYRLLEKCDNLIMLSANNESIVVSKEYFKEHFKMKAV